LISYSSAYMYSLDLFQTSSAWYSGNEQGLWLSISPRNKFHSLLILQNDSRRPLTNPGHLSIREHRWRRQWGLVHCLKIPHISTSYNDASSSFTDFVSIVSQVHGLLTMEEAHELSFIEMHYHDIYLLQNDFLWLVPHNMTMNETSTMIERYK